jgi:hypothetical protein
VNPTYQKIVRERVEGAVRDARALQGVRHKVLQGRLREILLGQLFLPLFPPEIGLGTGEIISAKGKHSAEQDILIYSRDLMPPVVYRDGVGLFPIEGVLYSIEVKSKLTAKEIRSADKNANYLATLDYLSGIYNENDQPLSHSVPRVLSTIFAFDSDLARDEIQRYDKLRGEGRPAIVAYCVAGKGYWDWSDKRQGWLNWHESYPYSEVVHFVAHVLNTWRRISDARGHPRFGNYLLTEAPYDAG